MAKDHFVPRHYLLQFALHGTKKIMVSKVSPYAHLREKGIGWACQQADFYEGNVMLNRLIWASENELAPVLVQVVRKEDFTEPEVVALRWLAAALHVRTKKAADAYKLLPKRIAYEVIQSGIESGKLPPCPDGEWNENMMGFTGVPGFLFKNCVIPIALEMQTLACKLLKSPDGAFFLTSDNPVMLLNQFCSKVDRFRNHAGFGKAGFQLLLPVSPRLCLIFYDAKVYKVGHRRDRLVSLSADDVEIVNALQIQSAEEFVFFSDPKEECQVQMTVARYSSLRIPLQDCLQTYAGPKEGDQLLHFKKPSLKLPKEWAFCRRQRHVNATVGNRRNPAWTALIGELMDDFEKNPNGGDMHSRIQNILADPNSMKNIHRR
jgi:hypothetical protein